MSRTKRNYRIKTFEKLEGLGLSNEKEILNMFLIRYEKNINVKRQK